jgi:hypothetical protein
MSLVSLLYDSGRRAHSQIKYFRIADGILDSAMEEQEKARAAGRSRGGGRGGEITRSQGRRLELMIRWTRWTDRSRRRR